MSAIVERNGDFLQVIVVHRMLAKVSVIPIFVLYILEKYAWCLVGIGELWSGEFTITFFYENFQDVFKGILHQKIFYCLNLIFWIIMGCGIARFGRKGLKTTETWKFWLRSHLITRDLEAQHKMINHWSLLSVAPPLETPWRRASKPQVHRASKPLGTNFETKIFKFRWFLGPSD